MGNKQDNQDKPKNEPNKQDKPAKEPKKPKKPEPKPLEETKLLWYKVGIACPAEMIEMQGIVDGLLYNIFNSFEYLDTGFIMLKDVTVKETPPGIVYQTNDGLRDEADGTVKFGDSACLFRCYQAMAEINCNKALTVEQIVDAYKDLKQRGVVFTGECNGVPITCECQNGAAIYADAMERLNATGTVSLQFRQDYKCIKNPALLYKPQASTKEDKDQESPVYYYNPDLLKATLLLFQMEPRSTNVNLARLGPCGIEIPAGDNLFEKHAQNCTYVIMGWKTPGGGTHYTLHNKQGHMIYNPLGDHDPYKKLGVASIRFWTT